MTHKEVMQQALEAHKMLRDWIKAVPREVVLPAMPGIDGDWLDEAESNLRTALEQPDGCMASSIKTTICVGCGGSSETHLHNCPVAKFASQPEQEPVLHKWAALFEDPNNDWQAGYESARRWVLEVGLQSIDTQPAAQPEQEPVAWMLAYSIDRFKRGYIVEVSRNQEEPDDIPLYTTPPAAQQRKPLTDYEIWQMANDCMIGGDLHADKYARAIEAAHGIREPKP